MVSRVFYLSPGADIGCTNILKQKKTKKDFQDFQGRMRKKMTYYGADIGGDFTLKLG